MTSQSRQDSFAPSPAVESVHRDDAYGARYRSPYVLDEDYRACRLFPFMLDAQRIGEMVPGAKKRDDVDNALGGAKRIEKARQLARWAKADRADRAWVRYMAAYEAADYWRLLVVEGLAERRRLPVAEMAEKAMRENGEQA